MRGSSMAVVLLMQFSARIVDVQQCLSVISIHLSIHHSSASCSRRHKNNGVVFAT